jgi:photosystem II stability/assembly factor-like uncharacterized protein
MTKSFAVRAAVLAVVAGSAFAVMGCGRSASDARPGYLVLSPGPPLPARTGAHVWVVGWRGAVVTSANGGATWKTTHLGAASANPTSDLLWGVAFCDAKHGWAVGTHQTIIATTDGGLTWVTQAHGSPNNGLGDVAASDPDHAWAVGNHIVKQGEPATRPVVLATTDGGAVWETQHVRGPDYLVGVAFSDNRHGWAVGNNLAGTRGFILATTDGGRHWRVQREVQDADLSAVAATDSRHSWVVGSPGTSDPHNLAALILATTNGGARWNTRRIPTAASLRAVSFADTRHGWAAGLSGTILATTDGGVTWQRRHLGVQPLTILAVAFSDARHGWVVANKTTLLATSDAGASWTVVGLPPGRSVLVTSVAAVGPARPH